MINITYTNSTKTELPSEAFFDHAKLVLKKHGITDTVDVELKIVGEAKMRDLNNTFRHKDYATDVLSFPIWHDLDTIKAASKEGRILLGSIVVCLPVATRDAQQENKKRDDHINFLIEHSLLHLMGFHHEGDN